MCFSDRMVSLQKQFVVLLVILVIFGSIFNWTIKTQERNLALAKKHADIRVQQVKEEYVRQLQEKDELIQLSWAKHSKEMELECQKSLENLKKENAQASIANNSSKDKDLLILQEKNKILKMENEDLLIKLNNASTYIENNKLKMDKVEYKMEMTPISENSLQRNNNGITAKPKTVKIEILYNDET